MIRGAFVEKTFDVDAYISRIGERLVREFDDAKSATSPTAVGDAMEHPVRKQLEQILPRGIAVGSGFVIDSNGGTSSQTDIVLYERDICPVFAINDTPESTYYPCEGVIAVGQVKSVLTRRFLEDEINKIASVKRLERYAIHEFMPHPTTGAPIVSERSYGNLQTPSVLNVDDKGENDGTRQIFGFILAGTINLKPETLSQAFIELTHEVGESVSPNMAVVMEGGLWRWGKITKKRREKMRSEDRGTWGVREFNDGPDRWEDVWSGQSADMLGYSEDSEAFRTLIRWLYEIYRTGKTSNVQAFDRYFQQETGSLSQTVRIFPKLKNPMSR